MIAVLQDQIRAAAASRTLLRIRAGGSKDFYGNACVGEVLDPRGHAGIVAYDPCELVVTVRCGTPLAELQRVLDEHQQMLAFEPPHFGEAATVGGCIASGLSGPRRAFSGAVRDFVLGAKLLDGNGELLSFGGQVMKNVAGFDVSRLLAGSLGVLGVLLEVSLKVQPKPAAVCTLAIDLDETEAMQRMADWRARPLPVSATSWHDGRLLVRLSGAHAAVQEARARLGGDELHGEPFWEMLREQRAGFFSTGEPLWRLSLPPTAPVVRLGQQWIEWSGAQRWLRSDAPADVIRNTVGALGGHATRFRGDAREGVFTSLSAPLLAIHRRLKSTFDPAGIFNRGRLYAELD